MAERVHPADFSDEFPNETDSSGEFRRGGAPSRNRSGSAYDYDAESEATAPEEPLINTLVPVRHQPPQGSYVIQVPKDQIFRVPPPGNARRAKLYARRADRRRRCNLCCFLAFVASLLALLVVAAAVAAGVVYFVFHPKIPHYSITGVSIKSFHPVAGKPLSPEFDVTVQAENPNGKIGFYYRAGSAINVYYSGVGLANGVWPAFFQGRQNVTVFQTALTGSGILLSSSMQGALTAAEKSGKVPLSINVKVPVRVKLGGLTTPTFTVRVACEVTVNNMTADASIVSKQCGGVKIRL